MEDFIEPEPERDIAAEERRGCWIGFFVVLIAWCVAVAGVILLLAGQSRAQGMMCGAWEVVRKGFEQSYREVPIGGGMIDDKRILSVLASPDGSTFTIMIVSAQGIACAIASGKDWNPGKLPQVETKG